MNGWAELPFLSSDEFVALVEDLDKRAEAGISILPERKNWFRAFRATPFDQVKVVVLGQDPYPTKSHACGLAFSVPDSVKPLPKSLINIYQELKDDLGIVRTSGNLEDWANQGILLLNTSLTTEEGKPASHPAVGGIGWGKLTDQAIKALSDKRENIVFVLWGNHAQSKARLIDDEKHHVIVSTHPSPLSAYRGFFGSRPFSRTNEYLQSKNITPISW